MSLSTIYSTIDPRAIIKNIVPFYSIDEVLSCHLIKRSVTDTYLLTTNTNKYIVKIYSHHNDFNELNNILTTQSYIAENKVRVSKPIETVGGSNHILIDASEGRRTVVFYNYANGRELTYRTNYDAIRYGKSVAQFHKSLEIISVSFDDGKTLQLKRLFQPAIDTIKTYLSVHNHKEKLAFFELLTQKVKQFTEQISGQLEEGLCHGDLHGGNAHFNNADYEFFDLEYLGYGPIIYDLATFKWACYIGKRQKQWYHFLEAYLRIKNINRNDLEACDYFVLMRDFVVMAEDIKKTEFYGSEYIHPYYLDKRFLFYREYLKDKKIILLN